MKNLSLKHKDYLLLIAIALFGFLLRYYNINDQSYWADEIFTLNVSNPSNKFQEVFLQTVSDVHPPIYQIFLWAWFNIFGYTEYSGRLLSALFGFIGIIYTYLLGREFFHKEVGFYAAILSSLNIFLITYSQELRSYSFLATLSIASFYYYLVFLKNLTSKTFIPYLLSTILLVNTHFFGWLIFFSQGIIFLHAAYSDNGNLKKYVIYIFTTVGFISISILPYFLYIISNLKRQSFWISQPEYYFFINYIELYFGAAEYKGVTYSSIMILITIISYRYFFTSKKTKQYTHSLFIITISLLIIYILPFIKGEISTPILTARNTIIATPLIIILAAFSISLFNNSKTRAVIMILISLTSFFIIDKYYSSSRKPELREVIYYLSKSNYEKYDIVGDGYFYDTYSKVIKSNNNFLNKEELQEKFEKNNLPECFWIAQSHGDHYNTSSLIHINNNFRKVITINKLDASATLFQRDDGSGSCLTP